MKEGAKITKIRNMTEVELANEGWNDYHLANEYIVALELDNDTVIYPSRDYEGNGAGVLFGYNKKTKKAFAITPVEEEK
tara:strand:+ start:532 stop:768 length:237 start_codon:yes stop_codon:yes gene_type:complete